YAGLLQLLASPEAKEMLAPVLRELAQAEGKSDPLSGATWLYLAGDYRAAAAAYQRYLTSPAGSPDAASASQRYTAAALGVVCARRGADAQQLERLTHLAIEEMPFAEMEMGNQQTLSGPLLDAVRGTPGFSMVFTTLARTSPQAAWLWI